MFTKSPNNGRLRVRRHQGARSNRRGMRNLFTIFVALMFFALTMTVLMTFDPMEQELLLAIEFVQQSISESPPPVAAIIPFDLSVNNLQRIPYSALRIQLNAAEDFLPIVSKADNPQLRFRLRGTVGASPHSAEDISAYRIQAEHAHSSKLLWDSGKVHVKTMPRSVPYGGSALSIGTVVKWRVSVWDNDGMGPMTSDWTKFGIGPSADDWTGKWITHPNDFNSFQKEQPNLWRKGVSREQCDNWKKQGDLTVARAKVQLGQENKQVVSALLVVSGLGFFAASLDGIPLSTSGPHDPPMTDFTQRVSYRGYDVTSHFAGANATEPHVVSVILGRGWWDALPLTASIVKMNMLPRGSVTTIAEMHFVFGDGTTAVRVPSGASQDWQVAKGFLRESDLFTGDVIDLGFLHDMHGWDSPEGWTSAAVEWIDPVLYTSEITTEMWRNELAKRAGAKEHTDEKLFFTVAPIGRVVPTEAPPVLPIEELEPESIVSLGNGRWLLDFGKAMSGVLRFDDGLPKTMVPEGGYPRGHSVITRDGSDEAFVTVVYGEALRLDTGDINLLISGGMGLKAKPGRDTQGIAGPCFPKDHEQTLTQRDVFIVPEGSSGNFADARQTLFAVHGFRFAEVCCTKAPPKKVHALAYRTAFAKWGKFESSNVILNGAYEMTRNALNANMLGTQTDCPHRERFQYGGDLIAVSGAAMHMFDLSAFYSRLINDWLDTQWPHGGYTETSIWQDLNEYAAIGKGAGETVWASVPPILTVRHTQHYGDLKLAENSFDHHVKWLEFLQKNFEDGMFRLFYNKTGNDLARYHGKEGGLGDWLTLLDRDTWLTHHAFYMASARSVAYLANKLGKQSGMMDKGQHALALAEALKAKINSFYMKDDAFRLKPAIEFTPGPELGLFAKIVPGPKRCVVVKNWLRVAARGTPKALPMLTEETNFVRALNENDLEEMKRIGIVQGRYVAYKPRRGTPEGILALRYNLRALSDLGFHHVALSKAAGVGVPSFEYMLSHNATTLWETWFRAEETYSRNHPMLGAVAEWLPSSVAGVSLAPTTVGGDEVLFWPRIPTTLPTVVEYASATQGTKRGDASIAWEFLDLPTEKRAIDSVVVKVHIRLLVPPGSTAHFKLPTSGMKNESALFKYAEKLPDFERAKTTADSECAKRRKERKGFSYNWEYDKLKKEWHKVRNEKAIGTPCQSFLLSDQLRYTQWSSAETVPSVPRHGIEISLKPGLYDVFIAKWQLTKEIEDEPGYASYNGDLGPECADPSTFSWDIDDATYLI